MMGTALLLMLSSCSTQNFVYWKNMPSEAKYPVDKQYETVIQHDDRLSIVVSSKSPELAVPFNKQGGAFSVSEDGRVTVSSDNTAGVGEKGYRVDMDGNIDFPILGKLHVEGLTLNAAS